MNFNVMKPFQRLNDKKMKENSQHEGRTRREFFGKILTGALITAAAMGIPSLTVGQVPDKQNVVKIGPDRILYKENDTLDNQNFVKMGHDNRILYTINKENHDTLSTAFIIPYVSNDTIIKTEKNNKYLILKNKEYDVKIKLKTDKKVISVELSSPLFICVLFSDGSDKTYMDEIYVKAYRKKGTDIGFEGYTNRKTQNFQIK